jgi:hypothetical protein
MAITFEKEQIPEVVNTPSKWDALVQAAVALNDGERLKTSLTSVYVPIPVAAEFRRNGLKLTEIGDYVYVVRTVKPTEKERTAYFRASQYHRM